ncbi:MAG: hypothetical protein RIS81_1441, partial [Actinomycetota bacterium]
LNEIRESMRIVRQVLDAMPQGDYRIQDKKVTPPPRGRIDESMEALIHHFKIFTEGFKVPEGEAYVAIEKFCQHSNHAAHDARWFGCRCSCSYLVG